jgi:hypothetical protein
MKATRTRNEMLRPAARAGGAWLVLALSLAALGSRRRRVAAALWIGGAAGLLAPAAAASQLQRGDLVVTDSSGARVLRVDRAGHVEDFSPPAGGANLLVQPAGIVVLDDGPVYVADQANGLIEIDRDTGEQHVLLSPVGTSPWGIDALPTALGAELFVSASAELHRVHPDPLAPASFEDELLSDLLPSSLLGVALLPGLERRPYRVWVAAGPDGAWQWKPAAPSQVVCWGEDLEGQASPPRSVATRPPWLASRIGGDPGAATAVATGAYHACAIEAGSGGVVCWGRDSDGQATPPPAVDGSAGTATAIAAGYGHTCAIQGGSGAVVCWGDDSFGEASPPASVDGTAGTATAIAAGPGDTCALQAGSGAVICWGAHAASDPPPAAVDGTAGSATAIAVGDAHFCAIQAGTSAVVCWGDDGFGKTAPPSSVDGTAGTATAVAAGANHTCAIQAGTEAIVCWGSDTAGQSSPPPGALQARAIAAGLSHSCAVLAGAYDGETVCWGSNGSGEREPPFLAAVPDDHASDVAAGTRYSCGLLEPRPAEASVVDSAGSGSWTLDLAYDAAGGRVLRSTVGVDGFGGCKPGSAEISDGTFPPLSAGGLLRCPMSLAVGSGGDEIAVADAATLLGFGGRIVTLRRDGSGTWSQSLLVDETTLGVPLPAGIATVPEPASGALGAAVLGALALLARRRAVDPPG